MRNGGGRAQGPTCERAATDTWQVLLLLGLLRPAKGVDGAKSLLVRAALARKSLYFISYDEWTNIWEETRPKYANLSRRRRVCLSRVWWPRCGASRVFWDTHARTGMRCGNVRLLSLQLFLPIICTCLVPFFSENRGKIAEIALTSQRKSPWPDNENEAFFGVFNKHMS